jgi:pimeloyl-ACP methyl ester carboxylesterase
VPAPDPSDPTASAATDPVARRARTQRAGRPTDAEPPPRRLTVWLLRVVGTLLMLSALALVLSRAPERPVETLVQRWGLPPSRFIELDGQLVHLRDVGPRADARPIVLLHGTSDSLHTWDAWVQALQAQRRVITLDLPGFGLTGPRADGDYRGDADARFVLALLDALQVGRFVVGGNSLGGEVAWRIATLAPARVDRLLLIDAAGLPPAAGAVAPLGWRLARVPGVATLFEWVLPRPLIVQGLVASFSDPTRIDDALVDRFFELTLREGNRRALAARLAQREPGADVERLSSLTLPTLILWGADDRLLAPDLAQEFARRIPGSRVVTLDGVGHLPQLEAPERSLQAVRPFLDDST